MEFRSLWESGRACPITLRSGINGKPISITIRGKKEDGVERRKGKGGLGGQKEGGTRKSLYRLVQKYGSGAKFPRGKA